MSSSSATRHSGSKRRHPEGSSSSASSSSRRSSSSSSGSRRFVPDIDSGRSVKKTRSQFLCEPHPSVTLPSLVPEHKLLRFDLPRERLFKCRGSIELQHLLREEAFVHPGLGIVNDPINPDLYNAPSMVPAGMLDPADKEILPDRILMAGKDADVAESARLKSFSWLRKSRYLTNDKYELMQANLSESDRQKMLLEEIRQRALRVIDRSRSGAVERIKASFAAMAEPPVNRNNPELRAVAQWEILPLPGLPKSAAALAEAPTGSGSTLCRFDAPPEAVSKDERLVIGRHAPSVDQPMLLQSVLVRQPGNTFGFYAPCGDNVRADRSQQQQRMHWIREYASEPVPQPRAGHHFVFEIQPEAQLAAAVGEAPRHGVLHYTRLTERLNLHKRIQTTADDANRDIVLRPATILLTKD